jgi:hypothetical protein
LEIFDITNRKEFKNNKKGGSGDTAVASWDAGIYRQPRRFILLTRSRDPARLRY